MCRSVPQIEAASTLTTTSRGPGWGDVPPRSVPTPGRTSSWRGLSFCRAFSSPRWAAVVAAEGPVKYTRVRHPCKRPRNGNRARAEANPMIYLDFNATDADLSRGTGGDDPRDRRGRRGIRRADTRSGGRRGPLWTGAGRRSRRWSAEKPDEIVFCGCGSEADNLGAQRASAFAGGRTTGPPGRLGRRASGPFWRPRWYLQRTGWQLSLLPVDAAGIADPGPAAAASSGRIPCWSR